MKMQIIKIGNSKGIRIPAPMLKQCGITDFIDVEIVDGTIQIKPSTSDKVTLDFHKIKTMSDLDIQNMLRATDMNSLAVSLAGLDDESKGKVYKNMSKRAYEKLITMVEDYEKMSPSELIEVISASDNIKVKDL